MFSNFLASLHARDTAVKCFFCVSQLEEGPRQSCASTASRLFLSIFRAGTSGKGWPVLGTLWRWYVRSGASRPTRKSLAPLSLPFFIAGICSISSFAGESRERRPGVLTDRPRSLFKADPFAWNPQPESSVSWKHSGQPDWPPVRCNPPLAYQPVLGREAFEQLTSRDGSCAGTVLWRHSGILKYLSDIGLTMQGAAVCRKSVVIRAFFWSIFTCFIKSGFPGKSYAEQPCHGLIDGRGHESEDIRQRAGLVINGRRPDAAVMPSIRPSSQSGKGFGRTFAKPCTMTLRSFLLNNSGCPVSLSVRFTISKPPT